MDLENTQVILTQHTEKKALFIKIAAFTIVLCIITGLIFYLYKWQSSKTIPSRTTTFPLKLKPLIEQGVQSAGGTPASNSAKTSPGPIFDTKTVSATIYQINADSVVFLTDKNQLLTFLYKKMALFTKAGDLKLNQPVKLTITSNIETAEINKVIVNSN